MRELLPGELLSFLRFWINFEKLSCNSLFEQLHARTVFQRKKGRIHFPVSNSYLPSVHPIRSYLLCSFGGIDIGGSYGILHLKFTEKLQGREPSGLWAWSRTILDYTDGRWSPNSYSWDRDLKDLIGVWEMPDAGTQWSLFMSLLFQSPTLLFQSQSQLLNFLCTSMWYLYKYDFIMCRELHIFMYVVCFICISIYIYIYWAPPLPYNSFFPLGSFSISETKILNSKN